MASTTATPVSRSWGMVVLALAVGVVLILTGQVILQVLGAVFILGSLAVSIARLMIGQGDGALIRSSATHAEGGWPLGVLHLDADVESSLKDAGIHSVKDVLYSDPERLLKLHGIGPKQLVELRSALEKGGFLPPTDVPGFESIAEEMDKDLSEHVDTWLRWPATTVRRTANR